MAALYRHRGALAVDFQERYGLRLREFLETASWNEAWELVSPLLRTPYSHIVADALGWSRPPEQGEEGVALLMDFYRQAHRPKNAARIEPMERPWRRPPAEMGKPSRSESDKAEGRAKLMRRLGREPEPAK